VLLHVFLISFFTIYTLYIHYKHENNWKYSYRCDFNQYTISYILRIGDLKSAKDVSKHSTIDDKSDLSIEEVDMD